MSDKGRPIKLEFELLNVKEDSGPILDALRNAAMKLGGELCCYNEEDHDEVMDDVSSSCSISLSRGKEEPERHVICSGPVQVGTPYLVVEDVSEGAIHYRVLAKVLPYFGAPVKADRATWTHTQGISSRGLEDLLDQITMYGAGLYPYRGRDEFYPYVPRAER